MLVQGCQGLAGERGRGTVNEAGSVQTSLVLTSMGSCAEGKREFHVRTRLRTWSVC